MTEHALGGKCPQQAGNKKVTGWQTSHHYQPYYNYTWWEDFLNSLCTSQKAFHTDCFTHNFPYAEMKKWLFVVHFSSVIFVYYLINLNYTIPLEKLKLGSSCGEKNMCTYLCVLVWCTWLTEFAWSYQTSLRLCNSYYFTVFLIFCD